MMEVGLNLLAVATLYCLIELCLKRHTEQDLDEASLMLFADDPEVARRVEQATGKRIQTVAIADEAPPAGWGDLKM